MRKRSLPALIGVGALAWVAMQTPAMAQAHNPFSVGISEGGGSAYGLLGWLLAKQSAFEQMLSGAVRAVKADGSALWILSSLSFAYGVFHAAGPGHGKAVVASYMFANERTLRRGIIISVLAGLLQGAVAIMLVGILALVFHATAQRMKDAAQVVESLSYACIAALGFWMILRKGRVFVRMWRAKPLGALDQPRAAAAKAAGNSVGHSHQHASCSCTGRLKLPLQQPLVVDAFSLRSDTRHACGHVHAPDPTTLDAQFSWTSALMTIVAAGLRPCSGAILVLVFALAQGIFAAGVIATLAMSLGTAITTSALAGLAVFAGRLAVLLSNRTSARGELVLRAIEVCAGFVIFSLGIGLLVGVTTSGA